MPVYHTPNGPVESLEWGEGDEVFVLAHAAAAGPGALSGLAKALARPGRRIIAPALNFYGGTALQTPGGQVAGHAAAIEAILDAVPVSLLFGHSMGGLAALLTRHPVPRLVLYEPILTGLLREDDPDDLAARAWDRAINAEFDRRFAAGDAEGAIAAFVEAWNETRWTDLPEAARSRLITAAASLGRDMHDVSFFALEPDAIAARENSLLLRGTRSPPITARMTARLAAAFPAAHTAVLDGCGHMAPVLNPGRVAAAITDWLLR